MQRVSFSSCSAITKRNRQQRQRPLRRPTRLPRPRWPPSSCSSSSNSNSSSSICSNNNSWPRRRPDLRPQRRPRLPRRWTLPQPRLRLRRPVRQLPRRTWSTRRNRMWSLVSVHACARTRLYRPFNYYVDIDSIICNVIYLPVLPFLRLSNRVFFIVFIGFW